METKNKVNKVLNDLKGAIASNEDRNNNIDYRNQQDNKIFSDAIKVIAELNTKLDLATKQLNQQNNNTLSTTEFFNPSLSKDFYNMNGNSLQTNSYMAIRQLLGIVNNNTPNVKQPLNLGGSSNNLRQLSNGSGVGLTVAKQIQGWWLWLMILKRIDYFSNLFKIECEDKKLLKALRQYLKDAILSGAACIIKKDDKYYNYSVTSLQINSDGELIKGKKYNTLFCMGQMELKENEGLTDFMPSENSVWGLWRSNTYSIWFYVMSYLMNAVDLLYICWNRSRLNKTIVLQKKGNNSTASSEAMNFIDAYQNVVTVNTVNTLDSENNTSIELQNRYEIMDLGNGQETQYSYTNFKNWISIFDSMIGLRSSPVAGGDGTRSITDEVQPDKLEQNKLQMDFLNQFNYLLDEIKEKWGIEVKASLEDLEEVKQNPETKEEEGNQEEQEINNGNK